jgi:hypothetical protein
MTNLELIRKSFERITGVADAWANPLLTQTRNGFIQGWEAALQQRGWQGLTLDEIFDIWRINHDDIGAIDKFARAIEAKLKEKNFG